MHLQKIMDYAAPNYRCLAPNPFVKCNFSTTFPFSIMPNVKPQTGGNRRVFRVTWTRVVRLLLPRTLSPEFLLELFIHIEDDGTNGAVQESLGEPEDKIPFMQMWIGPAVTRPMVVNRTEIILQKRTWLVPEN